MKFIYSTNSKTFDSVYFDSVENLEFKLEETLQGFLSSLEKENYCEINIKFSINNEESFNRLEFVNFLIGSETKKKLKFLDFSQIEKQTEPPQLF